MAVKAFGVDFHVTRNDLGSLRARFAPAVRAILGASAFSLEGAIKQEIQRKGLIDTGTYVNSWHTLADLGGLRWEVGSNVEYGPYLEYGTRYMTARPHVTPMAAAVFATTKANLSRLSGTLGGF